MPATKVATCSYCGTRAALVLRGRDRHELTCSSCGAPLHDMKRLKTGKGDPERPARSPRPAHYGSHDVKEMPTRRRKQRKKGLGRRVFEELWDVVEDIID